MEVIVLALLVLVDLMGVALLWRMVRLAERPVPPPGPAPAMEGPKKPDPVDEGFENLMRYAVQGKTGFEVEEE